MYDDPTMQDAAVFDAIARWRNAPSDTASTTNAERSPDSDLSVRLAEAESLVATLTRERDAALAVAGGLLDALNAFDDKWYPMLAGVGIGEAHLGHDELAARWGAMCREFRSLVEDSPTSRTAAATRDGARPTGGADRTSSISSPSAFHSGPSASSLIASLGLSREDACQVLGWGDFRQCSGGQIQAFAVLAGRLGLTHLGQPPVDIEVNPASRDEEIARLTRECDGRHAEQEHLASLVDSLTRERDEGKK